MTRQFRRAVVAILGMVAVGGWATILSLAYAVDPPKLQDVNVKFKVRGYCYAGSRNDDRAPGGFGRSSNSPQWLIDPKPGEDGKLTLVALPQVSLTFGKTHRGMAVLLVNRTGAEIPFEASDSRLPIMQEAQDADGVWKPIEYLPSSWCGNSYHRVFLPVGQYWQFAAPAYVGTMKTKLRFVMSNGKQPLYSNEFAGSINPEQFTEKQGHQPTDIMDPYFD